MLIGDLFENLFQQVTPFFLYAAADPLVEVVKGAEVEVPCSQLMVAQSIMYLHVEDKCIIQFFIDPAKAHLDVF
jgi:hypothetical protein